MADLYTFSTGCPDCGGIARHADCCDWSGTGAMFDADGNVIEDAGRPVASGLTPGDAARAVVVAALVARGGAR